MTTAPRRTQLLRSALALGAVIATASGVACSSSSSTGTESSSSATSSSAKSSAASSKAASSATSTAASSATSSVVTSSVSSAVSSATSTVASSSTSASSASSGGDGGACAAGTLYTRLGGHDGIRAAVDEVVAAELMNADIKSYFFFQAGAPANGHPTSNQIEECFTDLVGHAAGGTETYPSEVGFDGGLAVDGGTNNYTCRSIVAAHRALQIDKATFAEFITIAGGVLTPALCPADLTVLAGALESFGEAGNGVVTVDGGGNDAQPFPGNVDAASKLDATY